MRSFNNLLLAVLICVSACGRQIVEFGGNDASVDAAPIAQRPVITSTMPSSGAMGVALNTLVTATFSKQMDAGTLTTATFTLRQGTTALAATVTMDAAGTTATLTPAAPLEAGLVYTATVTTGATDTDGLSLAASRSWMFSAAANAVAPTVTSTMPTSGATNVAVAVSPTATFSKAMNPTTINTTTFTLSQGATPIAGTVTLNGATNTATFDPTANLTAGLVYTARITTGAQDTGGVALAAVHTWMFTAGTAPPPPMVSSTTPTAGAMNVAVTVSPTATFNQTMNPATINTTTFTVTQAGTPVAGVVTLNAAGTTATFNPNVNLPAGLVYVATITTGAQGTNGVALATNVSWMFTTASPAPTVTSTTPANLAIGVALNVSPTATFSVPMNPATINTTTFTLRQGGTPIVGVVTLNAAGTTATFNPTNNLTGGLVYTATITTGAQGTNGVPLTTNFVWTFTTQGGGVAPTVTSNTPLNGATAVGLTISPTATFSQAMNPATINTTTFTVTQAGNPVLGVVTLNGAGTTATFNPTMDLTAGLVYTATITTGAQGTNGMPLAMARVWTFSTSVCTLAPVALGAAAGFAVLAGSTVTNTGATAINGDVGVYPGTAITGFGTAVVTGDLYAGIAPADTAQGNLTTAYNDAAGRTLCVVSVAGNLGGMTLAPGLYKSTSFLEVSSGDLVLDAQGDPNAVWIFQMTAGFTVFSNQRVLITNGGSAANVFWQVGSSAVFETDSVMVGTIMADQSISFATRASLVGRALARIAAVTLDATTITLP